MFLRIVTGFIITCTLAAWSAVSNWNAIFTNLKPFFMTFKSKFPCLCDHRENKLEPDCANDFSNSFSSLAENNQSVGHVYTSKCSCLHQDTVSKRGIRNITLSVNLSDSYSVWSQVFLLLTELLKIFKHCLRSMHLLSCLCS